MKELLKQHFRPEFLNRIDEIDPLPPAEPGAARRRSSTCSSTTCASAWRPAASSCVLTDAAKKLLAEEGYDPTYGARPLKRVIQQRIENPLAGRILSGEFGEGDTIHVKADPNKGAFAFEKGADVVEGELVGQGA